MVDKRSVMFEFQNRKDIIVVLDRNLHQSRELATQNSVVVYFLDSNFLQNGGCVEEDRIDIVQPFRITFVHQVQESYF